MTTRFSRPLVAALVLSAVVCAVHGQQKPVPPALDVRLAPHSDAGEVDYLDVRFTVQAPKVAAGQTLIRLPLVIASIPTVRLDGDAVKARDEAGDLPLTPVEEAPSPVGAYRHWTIARATKGDVTVTYRAPMRQVSAATRPGPLFDLRADHDGMLGAGLTFLALPDTKESPYKVHLRWDLMAMPAGSRGVWSLGEGDVQTLASAEDLRNTYYAAGPAVSVPQDGKGHFAMYWFGRPPFDTDAVARDIKVFYDYEAKFFHDPNADYRVFIRHNPYRGGGGTALMRSFVFGYDDVTARTREDLLGLLSHEITHNWPRLTGDDPADNWYSEGTAEYYSILLRQRAGVTSFDQFVKDVNGRASNYYTNPLQTQSLADVFKATWSDSRAQRVPYGRGFMYLVNVDAQIREKSAGRRSLDDVVNELLERQRRHQPGGVKEWLDVVSRETGVPAKADYDAMVAGKMLTPHTKSFAPCLRAEPAKDRPFELGYDMSVLVGMPVKNLVAESAAARAGLRNGDVVLDATNLSVVQDDPAAEMAVKVRRGTEDLSFRYLPRGEAVDAYRWVRVPGVADSACRF